MKIRKVIIPAAGLGTRFLPATKAIPKEMLPIIDKPCIQYLVEEAVASGIEEVIIITGPGKNSLKNHFDYSSELHETLKERSKINLIEELEKIEKLAKFHYVLQDQPLGDGHAILCAKELVKGEPFAVLFGDDIWDCQTPPLQQLIDKYEEFNAPIISLEKIQKENTEKYGIVDPEESTGQAHKLKGLTEKPHPSKAPSDLAITGKYIITPELLEILSNSESGSGDKEIRLIDGMRSYIKDSPIYGCEIKGHRFDTGDKLGYLKAVVHFGLKHKKLGPSFKKHLQGLDF